MNDVSNNLPPAWEHGNIVEVFPDIFFVTGAMKIAGRPLSFSRNMTIVRENGVLTLINSIRLSNAGLKALAKLGKVENVIRLAGFHGRDDAFYKQQFGASVCAVHGQVYVKSFDATDTPYFEADYYVDDGSQLPISDARLYTFRHADPPEAVLLMLREGGILVAGDSLQNWCAPDRYFSLLARVMMRFMGFIKPCNIGPGWLKSARPAAEDLSGLMDLRFRHVLPAHGDEVIGDAKEKWRPAISKTAATLRKGQSE